MDQGTEHSNSNITIPGVRVVSRLTNNLTVEVDEPTLYSDVLTTSREPLPPPGNQSSCMSNGLAPTIADQSTTNASSDGSTLSEPIAEEGCAEYVRDENGRIQAYIDFAAMELALTPLKHEHNPLKSESAVSALSLPGPVC